MKRGVKRPLMVKRHNINGVMIMLTIKYIEKAATPKIFEDINEQNRPALRAVGEKI